MTALLLGRVGMVGFVAALSFACSDGGSDAPANGGDAGSAGAASGMTAGASGGGGELNGTSGSINGAAGTSMGMGGNGGLGGSSAGNGGNGGNSAGAGGMITVIDPSGGAPTGPAKTRHRQVPSGSMMGTTAGYWEYLPPHYGNGAKYPLLVFRHGIGENGNGTSELKKVAVHGPPKLIEANQWPEERQFVVLSVQHTGGGCATPKETDDFIQYAKDNYDIDPKRVYLTGLSCGSIGSWDYLGEHVDEDVAAAVLICGNGRPAFMKAGCALGKVPIWAFHGLADDQVDPKGSTEAIASLKACTNPPAVDVKLTTYPGVGHDSWTQTYDLSNKDNDIYAWMMSHQKP